ncbi:MAG: WecB/TagA/CpsF family glycosyltransferase [Bacillota bacterium]
MKKAKVLEYEVCDTDYREILHEIKNLILSKRKSAIISLNPNKVMLALKDGHFKGILQKMDYLIPDGTGILLASNRTENKIKNRITGISLFDEICLNAVEIGAKIFLLGASSEVVQATKVALEDKYPEIIITGILDGYFENDAIAVEMINSAHANILAVAMGSPKQEIWISENADKLENINVMIGLGGAFDVISGRIKRAPNWIIKLGLEWLYRILRQPISRFKYFVTLIRFCKVVLTQKK